MYNVNEVLKDQKVFYHVTKQLFEAIDSDGSGYISEDELWIIMCSLADDFDYKRPTLNETHEISEMVDVDKSGLIDLPEFRKLIRKILKAVKEGNEKTKEIQRITDDNT